MASVVTMLCKLVPHKTDKNMLGAEHTLFTFDTVFAYITTFLNEVALKLSPNGIP